MGRQVAIPSFLLRALALTAAALLVGALYLRREEFVPYWDFARIEGQFFHLSQQAALGPAALVSFLHRQVNTGEYNAIFGLPLLVAPGFFGASRDHLLLGVLGVYTLASVLTFGLLLQASTSVRRLSDLRLSALMAPLLVPPLFTATLRGFETLAAPPLVTLGLALQIGAAWPKDSHSPLGRRLGLGLASGVAVATAALARRAFMFAAAGFFLATALALLGELVSSRWRPPAVELRRRFAILAATGAGAALLLLSVAVGRIVAVAGTPYDELYGAWRVTPAQAVRHLSGSVGWVLLLAVATAYPLLLVRGRSIHRRAVAFLIAMLAAEVALWLVVVRFPFRFDKPLLLAPVLAFPLGVLAVEARGSKRWRWANGVLLAVLALNVASALGAVPKWPLRRSAILALPMPPVTRPDMPELKQMVSWLRERTVDEAGARQPVFVVAASRVLSQSLLANAETTFFGWGNAVLRLPQLVSVDRSANYPIWLHEAAWVLVLTPFQFHSDPDERRLLRFVYDELMEGRGIASDFELLPERFELKVPALPKVEVLVFRRQRPSSPATLLDLLERARRAVVHPPVHPNLWIPGPGFSGLEARRRPDAEERYDLLLTAAGVSGEVASALWLEPLDAARQVTLRGRVRDGLPAGCELVAELLNPEALKGGSLVPLGTVARPLSATQVEELYVSGQAHHGGLLRLAIRVPPGNRLHGHLTVAVEVEVR